MIKKSRVRVFCDVCGKEIDGDYMTIRYANGFRKVTFHVHLNRTAPLDPCGEKIAAELPKLFPKRNVELL